MSRDQRRFRVPIVILLAVGTAAAGVALVMVTQDSLIAAETHPGRATNEATQPDPDEDIHSLPTSTSTPADKSTMKPPRTHEHTFNPATDWQTGVFTSEGAPTSSINFVAENYWNGYLGSTPVTVYGGSPGYEHVEDGAVFVITITPQGNFGSGAMHSLKGVGALTVVAGVDDQMVTLTNARGARFVYDLSAEQLRAAG